MRKRLTAGLLWLGLWALPAAAAPPPAPLARGSEVIPAQPILATDGAWVGVLLIVSAGLFLSAAIIGPIVEREFPDEVPPAHAHDEPPGSSHRHGPGGTFAPEPR